jgi:hypothetical protein
MAGKAISQRFTAKTPTILPYIPPWRMEVKAQHLSCFLIEKPVHIFPVQMFSFVHVEAEFRDDTSDPLPSISL